ncbi:MAG: penicillin-binding transpeptidase domain-containing protein, partial [Luteococcus japonicus]
QRAVGNCDVVKMAQAAGVARADGKDLIKDPVPGSGGTGGFDTIVSFTLGPVEVTPLSMAQAYATFANRGVRCDPIIIKSVTTKAGKSSPVPSANCTRTIDPEVADQVTKLLEATIASGTARPANLDDGRDQAAKTGTTDSAEAVWLAGFTPDMAGVSLIAADKQAPQYKGRSRRSITGRYSHGTDYPYGHQLSGSGSGDAGLIWRASMRAALEGGPRSSFHAPTGKLVDGKEVEIPDITGLSFKEAMAKVEAAGFSTEVTYEYSSYSEGTYLYAYPTKGKRSINKPITFVLSQGPRPVAPKPKPTATRTRTTQPTATRTRTAPKPTASKTTTKPKATTTAPKPTASKTTTKPKATTKPKTTTKPKATTKPKPTTKKTP